MDPNIERENMVKGIKRLIALALIAVTMLLMLMIAGCVSQTFMTRDKGVVVDMGEQWVEVMYQVVDRPSRAKALNTYYKEKGHLYNIGDIYPDPDKERNHD